MLWPYLLQTCFLGNNWSWWLGLILDTLICSTFTLSTCHISILTVIIGGVLCSIMCSTLILYITSIIKTNSSNSEVYNTISTYCGNTCSTSLLSRSSSCSSWLCWYCATSLINYNASLINYSSSIITLSSPLCYMTI